MHSNGQASCGASIISDSWPFLTHLAIVYLLVEADTVNCVEPNQAISSDNAIDIRQHVRLVLLGAA